MDGCSSDGHASITHDDISVPCPCKLDVDLAARLVPPVQFESLETEFGIQLEFLGDSAANSPRPVKTGTGGLCFPVGRSRAMRGGTAGARISVY